MARAVRLGPATVVFTDRADGDFGPGAGPAAPGSALLARRRAVADLPWHTVRQVHGRSVATVAVPAGGGDAPGAGGMVPGTAMEAGAAMEADALVTAAAGVALAVKTADCPAVALAGDEGVVGVAHAGWRGLVAGVLGACVAAMRDLGATRVEAALGPCIGPECYAFSPAHLDEVADRLGADVRGVTATGEPALDLPAAVRAVLAGEGVSLGYDARSCTACHAGRWFSHRARGEPERQATVVWRG